MVYETNISSIDLLKETEQLLWMEVTQWSLDNRDCYSRIKLWEKIARHLRIFENRLKQRNLRYTEFIPHEFDEQIYDQIKELYGVN